MLTLPSYQETSSILAQAGAEAGPAEFHGLLAGLICAAAASTGERILEFLFASGERNAGDPALEALITSMQGETAASFAAGQMDFRPLLPDDDRPLDFRVAALADWCEGFLHGFGAGLPTARGVLPADVEELLQDFAELTRATADAEESGEQGELDYTEIVEYLRVGAQTIYESVARHAARGAGSRRVH